MGKIPWRRAWQPSPVFLPGKFRGQRSLVGYSLWGHKESDTTEWLTHTFKFFSHLSTGLRCWTSFTCPFRYIHNFFTLLYVLGVWSWWVVALGNLILWLQHWTIEEHRRERWRKGGMKGDREEKKGKRKGWVFCSSILALLGLPWWFSGKESACYCRRHGFEPWVGKIPWGSNWNGNPFHYSCLGNSIDQRASWSIVHGVAKESDTT